MDDNSIMKFGKHKGKLLKDVPNGWLVWMYDRGKLSGELRQYAEENVPILRSAVEKEKARAKTQAGF